MNEYVVALVTYRTPFGGERTIRLPLPSWENQSVWMGADGFMLTLQRDFPRSYDPQPDPPAWFELMP